MLTLAVRPRCHGPTVAANMGLHLRKAHHIALVDMCLSQCCAHIRGSHSAESGSRAPRAGPRGAAPAGARRPSAPCAAPRSPPPGTAGPPAPAPPPPPWATGRGALLGLVTATVGGGMAIASLSVSTMVGPVSNSVSMCHGASYACRNGHYQQTSYLPDVITDSD